MSEKKVIEQDKVFNPIEIEYLGHSLHVSQKTLAGYTEVHIILKSKATEVAKAIDPEYQKVIDQNTKLVEALNLRLNHELRINLFRHLKETRVFKEEFWELKTMANDEIYFQNTLTKKVFQVGDKITIKDNNFRFGDNVRNHKIKGFSFQFGEVLNKVFYKKVYNLWLLLCCMRY